MTASAAIDAAVEAVARALFKATNGARMYYDPPTWDEISESNKESWRYSAKVAVEAAAPVLQHHHFGEFMEEILTPVVKEHTHPAESCPCCQLYLAAQAKLDARGSVAGEPDTQGGHSG